MRITALAFSLALFAACSSGNKQPAAPAEPTPTQTTPPDPSQSGAAEPMTPEDCTTKGGEVRGDIGDGKVACAEGETDLGRVTTGIEGGLCCGK